MPKNVSNKKPDTLPRATSAAGLPGTIIDVIRRGILANELVPGQRLIEVELAKLFGASRSTVRSALTDLVHDGLVERIANQGARVRAVGLEEALQIVEVRMAIESLCAAKAAEKITDKDIVTLRNLGKQLKDLDQIGDVTGFVKIPNQIFETVTRIADLPIANDVLARLRARNACHRYQLTYHLGRVKASLPFWIERIEAICKRDPEAARRAVQRHSENVQKAMRDSAPEDSPFASI